MTGKEAIRKLRKLGFTVDHVTGSHFIMLGPKASGPWCPSTGP